MVTSMKQTAVGQVTKLPTEQAACTQQVYTTQSALTD